tara:strand:- start:1424 stop:2596 length:1173 start_codon:yes stop_codon:yes gene_type:complete
MKIQKITWVIFVAVLASGITDASAQQVLLPNSPGAWTALMEAVVNTEDTNNSSSTGDRTVASGSCHLFVTRSGHRALTQCTLTNFTPTTFSFFTNRWGLQNQLLASVDTIDVDDTTSVVLEMPPASFVDSLVTGEARLELQDTSGLLMRGTFSEAETTITTVSLDGSQVVPPSDSLATGQCDILVVKTLELAGVDCSLSSKSADTITLNAGARGRTGDTLETFTIPTGDSHPTAWVATNNILIQTTSSPAPYYLTVGTGTDVIRGQADGCRRNKNTLCLQNRFVITSEGELGFDDNTRGSGEAEPISEKFGLLRMRGTDKSGLQIDTLSGVTAYIKNSCAALQTFTVQLTLNAGPTNVTVRDTQTNLSRVFSLDSEGKSSVVDRTTFLCK